jgi:hypothetical protein
MEPSIATILFAKPVFMNMIVMFKKLGKFCKNSFHILWMNSRCPPIWLTEHLLYRITQNTITDKGSTKLTIGLTSVDNSWARSEN